MNTDQGRSKREAEEAVASSDLALRKHVRRFIIALALCSGDKQATVSTADGYFIVNSTITYASTAQYHY